MAWTIELPGEQSPSPRAEGQWTIELPETRERATKESLERGVGLATRAGVTGLMGIPNMGGDAVNGLINLGIRGVNEVTGAEVPLLNKPSEATQRLLTRAGVPEPETTGERLVYGDIAPAVLGAGSVAKLMQSAASKIEPSVVQRVIEALGIGPGMQSVGAGTGAAAGGIARESDVGPGGQLVASLVGAAFPGAAQAGGSAAVRGMVRGGERGRQSYADRLATFEAAGTTPSVGQASGSRVAQQAESGLANVSASAGIMDRAATREAQEMGAKIEQIAADYLPGANSTKAGLTIERGLRNFVDRFKGEQDFLYSKVDQHLPPQSRVAVGNTQQALAELNADIPGAPNLSEWFKNAKIQGIESAFAKDAGGESATLPYEAVKKLRTLVGNEITNTNLASAVPRDKWKSLYSALSDDMQAAAQQAGPEATKAFSRANAYTRAGYDRIESVLDRVSGKETAERVFQAAVNPSELREGGTTIRTVMKSLQPEERKAVTAAVVRRLGIASPGAQNEAGDVFSSQGFLTSWNKISPEAKASLFPDEELRNSLDQVAKASAMIRQGSKVFANPSGTTPALNNQVTGFSLAGSAMTGHWGVTASIATLLAGANASARLMTNPRFVRWLAKTTTMPAHMIPTQVQMLSRYAEKNWAKEDLGDLHDYLGQVTDAYVNGVGEQR